MQHWLVRVVSEGHVGEAHVAAQQRKPAVGRRDRLFMRLLGHFGRALAEPLRGFARTRAVVARLALPPPVTGLLRRLRHRTAVRRELDVDERDRAIVLLGRLVHQREDARGAGERHHDHRHLLRDLADRVHEGPRQREQRDDRANRERGSGEAQVAPIAKRGEAAEDRGEHIEQIAHVADDRHQHVAVGVRARAGVVQALVAVVERRLCGVLVVEDLDDLLPVDRLLDEGVHVAELLLLHHEVAARTAHNHADEQQEQTGEHKDEDRVGNRQVEHRDERRKRGHTGCEHLRQRLADRLA